MNQEIENVERLLEIDPDNLALQQRVDATYARHGRCSGCQDLSKDNFQCCREKIRSYKKWSRERAHVTSRIGGYLLRKDAIITSFEYYHRELIDTKTIQAITGCYCAIKSENMDKEDYVDNKNLTIFMKNDKFLVSPETEIILQEILQNRVSAEDRRQIAIQNTIYNILKIYSSEEIPNPTAKIFPLDSNAPLVSERRLLINIFTRLNSAKNQHSEESIDFSQVRANESVYYFLSQTLIDAINNIFNDKSLCIPDKYDAISDLSRTNLWKDAFRYFDKSIRRALVADLHNLRHVYFPENIESTGKENYNNYLSLKMTKDQYENHYRKKCKAICESSKPPVHQKIAFWNYVRAALKIGSISSQTLEVITKTFEHLNDTTENTHNDNLEDLLNLLEQNKDQATFALPLLRELEKKQKSMRGEIQNVAHEILIAAIQRGVDEHSL